MNMPGTKYRDAGAVPSPVSIMQITIFDNGRVQVNGPLINKPLCRSMLNGARDAIEDFKPPVTPGGIELAPAEFLDQLPAAPMPTTPPAPNGEGH